MKQGVKQKERRHLHLLQSVRQHDDNCRLVDLFVEGKCICTKEIPYCGRLNDCHPEIRLEKKTSCTCLQSLILKIRKKLKEKSNV